MQYFQILYKLKIYICRMNTLMVISKIVYRKHLMLTINRNFHKRLNQKITAS